MKGDRTMAYTATYEGGGLYRIFASGKCIGIVDGRRIDWNKVTVVKAAYPASYTATDTQHTQPRQRGEIAE